jgi:flagellar protein FlbD
MISLTRLTGAPFALNPDLVERVDCTPDTVITLVDGTKYLVGESLQEVADTILAYRGPLAAGRGAGPGRARR